MAKVVLTSTQTKNFSNEEINKTVARAIDLLDFNFNNKIGNVVVKPNLCYYWDYSTGETTDPRIVSALIDYVRSRLGRDINIFIAEADASAMKTKYSFKILGYDKLSQTKNVKLLNLSDGNIVNVKVNMGGKEFELPVNKIMLESNLIINVPKLKTHNVVGITCALKNMFGAIAKPRKYDYHKMLSYVIVGINKIVRSDIILVDGLIARGSVPRKLGVIVAGDDPLAADFTAAKIMGVNPRKVGYLKLAEKEQIGVINNIKLIEDNVKLTEIKNKFPNYSHFRHIISWKMQLKMLQIYSAIVGDIVPPFLEK
jgi:uncharacterized protein (DUF362 family)